MKSWVIKDFPVRCVVCGRFTFKKLTVWVNSMWSTGAHSQLGLSTSLSVPVTMSNLSRPRPSQRSLSITGPAPGIGCSRRGVGKPRQLLGVSTARFFGYRGPVRLSLFCFAPPRSHKHGHQHKRGYLGDGHAQTCHRSYASHQDVALSLSGFYHMT